MFYQLTSTDPIDRQVIETYNGRQRREDRPGQVRALFPRAEHRRVDTRRGRDKLAIHVVVDLVAVHALAVPEVQLDDLFEYILKMGRRDRVRLGVCEDGRKGRGEG